MLPCPWGRQQTGTLRLEYPRAQGSGIILACLTQVTQEQVHASHSEPNSCHERDTKREAARGTEETPCCSVLTHNRPSGHFLHALGTFLPAWSRGLDKGRGIISAGFLLAMHKSRAEQSAALIR